MAQLVNTEKTIDITVTLMSGQALIAGPFPVRPHAYTRTVWLDVDASLRIARELGITEAVSCFDAAERLKRAYPAAHIVYGSVQLDDEFVIWTHAWCMLDGSIIDPRYVVMDVYNDIHRYLSAGYFHTPVTAHMPQDTDWRLYCGWRFPHRWTCRVPARFGHWVNRRYVTVPLIFRRERLAHDGA